MIAFFLFLGLTVAESEAAAWEPDDDDDDDDDDATDDDADADGWPPPPIPPPGLEPIWPLPGISRAGKPTWKGGFGKPRGGTKLHAGIDLGAPHLTSIVAPEDGRIIRTQGWDGPGAKAIMFETFRADGPNILFGAVEPDSWPPVMLPIIRGMEVAKVGKYPGGSTMLHLETYVRGTKTNKKWFSDKPRPPQLRDPTPYVEMMLGG